MNRRERTLRILRSAETRLADGENWLRIGYRVKDESAPAGWRDSVLAAVAAATYPSYGGYGSDPPAGEWAIEALVEVLAGEYDGLCLTCETTECRSPGCRRDVLRWYNCLAPDFRPVAELFGTARERVGKGFTAADIAAEHDLLTYWRQ